MATEDVVRALFDAFARRDVDAALALAAPDLSLFPQGTAERSGRPRGYLGHEGLRRYFDDVAAVWEGLELEPRDFRAAGAGVVVFGAVRWRAGDEVVEREAIWVFKLRGDLICSARAVGTPAAAFAAAGTAG